MAIKGLTDRETLKPRLPSLGKLRKGGEKTDPKKPGKDLDYFRFTSDSSEIVAAFHEAYGDKPRLVNIVLYHETVEENFSTWVEDWDASGLVTRSDGETDIIWRDGSTYKRGSRPHQDTDTQFEVGRLECIIPELLQLGFVGTVTMETHSNHDLRHITAVLLAAERERSLRGTKFVLRRVEEEISTPGWGKRAGQRSKTNKWLVKLETPRRVFNNLLKTGQQKMIEATGEIVTEPPPTTTTETEFPPRPWPLTVLAPYMVNRASELGGDEPPVDNRRKYAMSSLSAVTNGNEAHQHIIIKRLFNRDSRGKLTAGECEALIAWIGAKPENEFQPSSVTVEEAKLFLDEQEGE